MDIVESAFDPETADPGTIVWHTSDGEGGPPDVAYQVILAKGESLWIGDITRDRYEDAGGEKMGLGGDGGWWLIHYKGRDATVLGKVNYEQASDLADLVSTLAEAAATITALRARMAELERVGRETSEYLRKLEANMLENDADMMLDDCLPPSFYADQIDAALRAKGGEHGDA